ncbi:Uncharacterized protein FKW44_009025, partial [Caligus rogercresseyi]
DDRVPELLSESSTDDTSECIKKLICILHGITPKRRTWDEQKIVEAISPKLEFQSQNIQLQLAAKLGRTKPAQCPEVYSRCPFDKDQLMTLIRQRGMSLSLPTSEDYDCSVIFLWKKKESKDDKVSESPPPKSRNKPLE